MRIFLLCVILFSGPAFLHAVDFWQHPEAAGENSLFLSAVSPTVTFSGEFAFDLPPPVVSVDWLLPLPLPFSAGLFVNFPAPDLERFGLRLAYHVNLGDRKTDLYILHVSEFALSPSEAVPDKFVLTLRIFDFRVGVRYLFNRFLCVLVETDYYFQGIVFGVSLKIL
jgi:hypothetical protein